MNSRLRMRRAGEVWKTPSLISTCRFVFFESTFDSSYLCRSGTSAASPSLSLCSHAPLPHAAPKPHPKGVASTKAYKSPPPKLIHLHVIQLCTGTDVAFIF